MTQNLILMLMLSIFMSACGGSNGGGGNQNQEEGTQGVVFDSELTPDERKAATQTMQTLSTAPIDGSHTRGFSEMFGGNTSPDVRSYVDTRVNYLISENTEFRSRIEPASVAATIFASNPSVFIWYEAVFNADQNFHYLINGDQVPIDSSRVGVMQIGEGLVQAYPSVQASTIVHEARHSDCQGGALESDITAYNSGSPNITNLECGHLHGMCPPGHMYAGMQACDLQPWGAYMADAIYSDAIVRTCTSCAEDDKQAAAINRADALSRAVFNVSDMLDGKLGPADMSNSNQVR